jgi:hypothetical protein
MGSAATFGKKNRTSSTATTDDDNAEEIRGGRNAPRRNSRLKDQTSAPTAMYSFMYHTTVPPLP